MNKQTLTEVHSHDLPQRVRNTLCAETDDDTRDFVSLKQAINEFCWEQLPGSTTLRLAEIIACKIFRLMAPGDDLGLTVDADGTPEIHGSNGKDKEKTCNAY